MESSSSSWTVSSLHQLLSFDCLKLSLVKCDDDKTSSSSSPSPRRRMSNSKHKINQVPSPSPCRICTHPSSHDDNQVLNESSDLLASLDEGTHDDEGGWTLCPFCLSLVRRLLILTEEVEDIKARIKAVIKLVKKSQSLPQPLDDDECPSPTHLKASFATLQQPSSLHDDDDEEEEEMIVLKEEPQGHTPPLHVGVEEDEEDTVSTPSSGPNEEKENDGASMSIEGPFTIPAAPIQTSQGGAEEEEEMEMENQSENENYHASIRSQGDDTSPIQSESFPSRSRVYRMRASTRQKKGKVDPDVPPPPPLRRPRGRPRHLPRQFHSQPLPCYFCGKTFSRDRSIEFHIRIHTLESPFLCAKCGAEFRFNESLRKHVTSNCGQVNVQRPPKVEKDHHHQEPRQQGKVQCHLCGTLLASSRQLDVHMKVRHEALKVSLPLEGKSSGFHCPKCVRTYVRQRSLVHHMKIHHLLDPSERQFCPICHEYFRSKDGLAAHTHLDPNNDPTKVLYICPISICSKTFPTREKYARHRNEIHRKRGSQCPNCGKVFRQYKSLVAHARTCSIPSDVQGTCSVPDCGKAFGSLAERMDHERVVHKGLSSTRCYFCSKVFSNAEKLLGHMRLHTLEAPFRCDKCGKDFRWCERFRIHRALVCGGDEGKKEKVRRRKREEMRAFRAKMNYACDLCDKRFGQKPQLVSHKRREHFM